MGEPEYESVVLVKQEVFVYKIPPRQSNRSYRAADWNLLDPIWTGRLRMVAKGRSLCVKLEDKTNGTLFANCPIESYPGVAIEAVSDSSRYFVLRIQDGNGRTAFIGLGFGDRSDSFDMNVALQDHFKWVKNEEKIEKEKVEPKQQLDLGFKEGETIKINMKITVRGKGPAGGGKVRLFYLPFFSLVLILEKGRLRGLVPTDREENGRGRFATAATGRQQDQPTPGELTFASARRIIDGGRRPDRVGRIHFRWVSHAVAPDASQLFVFFLVRLCLIKARLLSPHKLSPVNIHNAIALSSRCAYSLSLCLSLHVLRVQSTTADAAAATPSKTNANWVQF
ncbi:NECAP-like protein CG9132 isoform X1 [Anopheles gambiae]|nr:NECAP-like protein CG9132 isoform X1 [Anopheles gambiae]